jgi:hypothetical protein
VYDAYVERKAARLRHVRFLGAIAQNKFHELAEQAASNAVPWNEVHCTPPR